MVDLLESLDQYISYLDDIVDNLDGWTDESVSRVADEVKKEVQSSIYDQHTEPTATPPNTRVESSSPSQDFLGVGTPGWLELSDSRIRQRHGSDYPVLLWEGNLVGAIEKRGETNGEDILYKVGVFDDEKMQAIAASMELGSFFGIPAFDPQTGERSGIPPRSYLTSAMNRRSAEFVKLLRDLMQEKVR